MAYVSIGLGKRLRSEPSAVCPVCGSRLARISRKEAKEAVPERSYGRYRLFYLCKTCGRTYWHGTHWKKIRTALALARKLAGSASFREGTRL
ncbi:Mut7-C RNAse domain protein [uncultured archaeon]|nr:Mut7-C RNAse domain protein [uncultured archaeon]